MLQAPYRGVKRRLLRLQRPVALPPQPHGKREPVAPAGGLGGSRGGGSSGMGRFRRAMQVGDGQRRPLKYRGSRCVGTWTAESKASRASHYIRGETLGHIADEFYVITNKGIDVREEAAHDGRSLFPSPFWALVPLHRRGEEVLGQEARLEDQRI